jgi:hypothetical protein
MYREATHFSTAGMAVHCWFGVEATPGGHGVNPRSAQSIEVMGRKVQERTLSRNPLLLPTSFIATHLTDHLTLIYTYLTHYITQYTTPTIHHNAVHVCCIKLARRTISHQLRPLRFSRITSLKSSKSRTTLRIASTPG